MHRKFLFGILLFTFFSCKKENKNPQWDINIYGPLLHATLGINQLAGDKSILTTPAGAQILDFDTLISAFKIDSLYRIADTTITTINIFPGFPAQIIPGQSFPTNNNTLTLGLGNLQLKKAIVSKGIIRLNIKNTLQSKVFFKYEIPKAFKNGLPFIVNAVVDSGSITDPKYFTNDYDFSGYSIDMTGVFGNSVNSIAYNVLATSDPNGVTFNVAGLDTMINLKSTLLGMQPSYVSGYLGQANISANTTDNIGIGGLIKSGTVLIDSIQMKMDIVNYIGADAQALLSYFRSVNHTSGNVVDLISPSLINHYLNINRSYINSTLPDSLVPSHYSILLDQSNSNIKSFIENIPDKISYALSVKLNPQGNISGSNDYVFSDRLMDTRLQLIMPLRFAFNQLVLADTVPFSINNATDFNSIGQLKLKLLADNGFPFDMNIQLFLLNSANTIVDSLFVPDLISAAPYDVNYKATGIKRTEITIPVDSSRKERLLNVKRVGIRLKFNTPAYPQKIQLYSTYKLNLKMVADGSYSIR